MTQSCHSESNILIVKNSFQAQCGYRNQVFINDAIWHEDKLFVENLTANEVTNPIFIIQMKYIGHNTLNHLMVAGLQLRKIMP